ncbi:MAG: exodeoxyribonuclease VII small subunit [Clostridia bacterium]
MKFEQALNDLQQIVEKMESNDVTLDESLSLYEKGVELCNFCSQQLEIAKGKITKLTQGGEQPLDIK